MATWDPTQKTSGITLSGGNLIASNSTAGEAVLDTVSHSSGSYYFECTVTSHETSLYAWAIGLSMAGQEVSSGPGPGVSTNNDIVAYINDRHYYTRGGGLSEVISPLQLVSGDIIGVAATFSAGVGKLWMRTVNSGPNWNDDVLADQDPVTGAGGAPFSLALTGPLFIEWGAAQSSGGSNIATLNTGNSTFAMTLPSGFSAWDGTPPSSFDPTKGMFRLASM